MKGYLRYINAKLCSRYSKRHKINNEQYLSDDTLYALHHQFNQTVEANQYVLVQDKVASLIGRSIYSVLATFGKPYCMRIEKNDAIKYEVVLYKKHIKGIKSRMTYHFINGKLVMLMYYFKKENPLQSEQILNIVSKVFGITPESDLLFTAIDNHNNVLEVENAIDVTVALRTQSDDVKRLLAKTGIQRYTRASVKPVKNYEYSIQ
jgi:hypothetical protein